MPEARTRRRQMSLTSPIDVIFLLLLFFMLSSTFSRFAEVELSAAAAGTAAGERPPLFLRLAVDGLSLNGDAVALDGLAAALGPQTAEGETAGGATEGEMAEGGAARTLLVSLGPGVSAQRLTDLLGALRPVRGISVTVVGEA